jgi:glycosyltransferase involved in cell wall biosynthesis
MESLVSIGMPVYNNPVGMRKALEAITHQSYKNLEINISNDYSPNPEIEDIIYEFAQRDNRIRYFHQFNNLGIAKNFRFVLTKSTGEYFMYAQDDDWWSEHYIENCVKCLEAHPEYPIAVGITQFKDPDGNVFGTFDMKGVSVLFGIGNVELGFLYCGVWRKELLERYEFPTDTGVVGGDIIVVSKALMVHDGYGVVQSELYVKGLRHEKTKQYFKDDPWHHVKAWWWTIKQLSQSEYIPMKKKLLIPVIAITNLVWVVRAYAAQVLFLLPVDHPIRKTVRKLTSHS